VLNRNLNHNTGLTVYQLRSEIYDLYRTIILSDSYRLLLYLLSYVLWMYLAKISVAEPHTGPALRTVEPGYNDIGLGDT
jgi:hypothetical protein